VKTLRDIGEDELIRRLIRLVPLGPGSEGPGDDCAVVDDGLPWLQLLKTDALVAGVHFLMDAPPRAVGWKAAARVVSDFAAMAGRPDRFLITLALPRDFAVAWIEDFYRGVGDCLEKAGAVLAGGETSAVPDGAAAVISIAATGKVGREDVVLRSGARVGDLICVTGALGGSLQGRHLDFTPRLEEAEWLARHFKPTAMMDLSDGLAKDLPRLALASGVGYRLVYEALPCWPGCSIRQALGDGEDFELLFTVPPEMRGPLAEAWSGRFPGLALTFIGETVAAGSGDAIDGGGWEHFS
jgi:thiamine-monophosphate kinase